MSTSMLILASDSLMSAAIGSVIAAEPTLIVNVVLKPVARPASASSCLALARSVLVGMACGKSPVGGSVQDAPNRAKPRLKIAAPSLEAQGSAGAMGGPPL